MSNINCCQCCYTLVIADYSLCTFCPGRPYCSVGLWWWVKGWGLGRQDARHASNVFKTSSWQDMASHRWGPNGCGSDTIYWQLCVNMICFLIEIGLCIFTAYRYVSCVDLGISLPKYAPLNMTCLNIFKHFILKCLLNGLSGIMSYVFHLIEWCMVKISEILTQRYM